MLPSKQRLLFSALALLLSALVIANSVYAQMATQSPPTSMGQVNQLMDKGRTALDEGRLPDALRIFRQVLLIKPDEVEAHYRIGLVFWRQRQIQEAFVFFNKAIEIAPENASLHLSLAGFYEQASLFDKAVEEYRKVIVLAEGTEMARSSEKRLNLTLVKQYVAAADVDTALQILNSLLEEYPDDPRVLQHLGFAYSLAKRYEAAAAIYESVLEKEPENDSAHMNLANVYMKMGDVPNAITHFEKAAELSPQPSRRTEAKIRLGLLGSTQAQRKGDNKLAIRELEKVLEIDPNQVTASNRLAAIHREEGQLDEAEDVLLAAIRSTPENLDVRLNLASLYLESRNVVDAVWQLDLIMSQGADTPQAQQARGMMNQLSGTMGNQLTAVRATAKQKNELKQTLFMDSNNAMAHFNLGGIYMRQRKYDEAQVAFENVRRINPRIALTYVNLGEIYAQKGEFAAAADAFATYMSLETNLSKVERLQPAYASVLGQQFYKEGNYDAALNYFSRVLELNPKDNLARFYTAVIYSRRLQLEDAVEAYELLLETAPSHMGARSNLARIYEQLGQEEDALSQYRRVAMNVEEGAAKETADNRIKYLQRSINGLTSSAGYSLTFDTNNNLSEHDPEEEYWSSLNANFTYRYKYRDDVRLGATYSPTYSTYHIGQYDYINHNLSPFIGYGDRRSTYTARYTYNKLSGLLNEESVSETNTFSLDWNKELNPERKLLLNLSYRKFESASSSFFNANTAALSLTYSRNLGRRLTDSTGYTFSNNDNENPDNADAAFMSHTLNYQINKWFSPKFSLGITGSASLTDYLNPDRFAVPEEKRSNTFFSLRASFNYRVNDHFRLFGNAGYQQNDSNLPVFVQVTDDQGRPIVDPETGLPVFRPVTGEDLIGVPIQSASLGSYQKVIATFGLAVSF